MHTDSIVRDAIPCDVPAISRVLAASWKFAYKDIVDEKYLSAIRDNHWVAFLNSGLSDKSVFAVVIESKNEIIGAAILRYAEEDYTAELVSFYLLPDKIGYGLGHFFYENIEMKLRKQGYQYCILDVLEANERAIAFYTRHGFVDTGKTMLATFGEQDYICRILRKKLL